MSVNKKGWLLLSLAVVMLAAFQPIFGQLNLPRGSQRAYVAQQIGYTEIIITYHRPMTKNRKVWGNLVPFGKVWRTGANNATVFECSNDISIDGHKLEKGKYSFYAIPNKTEWTLIFNKTWKQWGTVYSEKEDALRITVKPSFVTESVEALNYSFSNLSQKKGTVVLAWEKARIPFTIDVGDTNAKIISTATGNINLQFNAAAYFLMNKQKAGYEPSLKWMNDLGKKYASRPRFYFTTLFYKAQLLAKLGNNKEAIEVAQEAITMAKKNKIPARMINMLETMMKGW